MTITMSRYAILLVFLLVTAIAAASGATFRPGTWYQALAKPAWTPPSALFAPVWSVLYVMIAVAGWLAWQAGGWSWILAFWGAQLMFNALWSLAMFGAHRIDLAMADLVLLWLSVAGFILASWPVSQGAALLFVPYLLWVSFAGALNCAILRLNA